ncbi:hypothetical protein ABIB62_004378 [Mucilaginibacter sp. UYP25]|uniref:hypothetical protein n=1 Tax=unclassified Mucilaginibacter TaxID=2617802 RepID=UPI003399DC37
MNDFGKNLSKVSAVMQEVEASFRFIEPGLINLRSAKFVGANNHVTLQLLAAGFERLLKILLLLKHKHLEGEFPLLSSDHQTYHPQQIYEVPYKYRASHS